MPPKQSSIGFELYYIPIDKRSTLLKGTLVRTSLKTGRVKGAKAGKTDRRARPRNDSLSSARTV